MTSVIMLAESRMKYIYEPDHYKEAISCDHQEEWKRTIDKEIKSHKANQTWKL